MLRIARGRVWPAMALALVAALALTLQASAEGPYAGTDGGSTVNLVVSPEGLEQFELLLRAGFLPQSAREVIASLLEQAGYDHDELAALIAGDRHRGSHDDDDHDGDRDHDDDDSKLSFCERVLADPDAAQPEHVERCQFLEDLASMTPAEVCDRALAAAPEDESFLETLIKRCNNAIRGDEVLLASVCAGVVAAGEPERLLATCLAAELQTLTPAEICDRALAAAPGDESILETLIKRCSNAIQGDEVLRASVCASVEAAGEPERLLVTCQLAELEGLSLAEICDRALLGADADALIARTLVKRCERAIEGDEVLRASVCASVAAAVDAPEDLIKACEDDEDKHDRPALREAVVAFFGCMRAAPADEALEAAIDRCAAEVEAEFDLEPGTLLKLAFGGRDHDEHDDDDDDDEREHDDEHERHKEHDDD